MLANYYDVKAIDQFDELFKGLYIHDNPTKGRNNFYVLRFNFSGIETRNVETILAGFKSRVRNAVDEFASKYQSGLSFNENGSAADILDSLFSSYQKLNLKHKIYILIDEYDHFTNAVLNSGLPEFMTLVTKGGTVRSFYEVIKQGTETGVVGQLFITGVMSVSLDTMTSGFNIATKITSKKQFSDMMGFTAEELKKLLNQPFEKSRKREVTLTQNEQTEIFEIMKENYNGYLFSGKSQTKVFNSTLIMYYLKNYIEDKEQPETLLDANLNQSGSTIHTLVNLKNSAKNITIINEIIENKTIVASLSPLINVDERYDENDFVTVLFNIGFLTIKELGVKTTFEVPNRMIEMVYLDYLRELIQVQNNYILDVSEQTKAIIDLGESIKKA
jgi:hypothetical protein